MATSEGVPLARKLRSLRDAARLTQGALAHVFTEDGRQVTAAAISLWEREKDPSPLPQARLEPYSRLPALTGSPPRLPPLNQLTESQRAERDELLEELTQLADHIRGRSTEDEARGALVDRSWIFTDGGPVVIVAPDASPAERGPFAEASHPNYVALRSFGDQDALIELYGHVRGENDPALPVFFKRASTITADDLSGHLVLLGSIAFNPVTRRLLQDLRFLPVRQIEVPELETGEIFAVGHGVAEKRFLPVFSQAEDPFGRELEEDVGLLVRVANPFNSTKTLTLCNGIHGRGVLGAVRALTDERIRDANEAFLATRFPKGEYALLLRVPVFHGAVLSPDLISPDNILYAWPSS